MKAVALAIAASLLTGCQGVGRLDFTAFGRDMWQRPEDVVQALDLRAGQRVADLGAGDGYFVPHLAEAVGPEGLVYAVEVEEELVTALAERFAADAGRVESVLGAYDDPKLPDAALDLVLLVNTYHHIEGRPAYFRRLRSDLRPGGRVAVIEPNAELGGVLALALDEGHKSSRTAVEAEMREAGYRLVATHDFLPVQIFQVFAPEAPGVADAAAR